MFFFSSRRRQTRLRRDWSSDVCSSDLEHGMEVGKKLAFVLSGGNTTIEKELSEDDLYALELESFIQLIQMEKTQARIKHTLTTGKPLVN